MYKRNSVKPAEPRKVGFSFKTPDGKSGFYTVGNTIRGLFVESNQGDLVPVLRQAKRKVLSQGYLGCKVELDISCAYAASLEGFKKPIQGGKDGKVLLCTI